MAYILKTSVYIEKKHWNSGMTALRNLKREQIYHMKFKN